MKEKEIKDFVKERYSKIATKKDSSCSCCSGKGMSGIIQQAKAVGYSEDEIKSIPADAIFGRLGCGNPTALVEIKRGKTVLDLKENKMNKDNKTACCDESVEVSPKIDLGCCGGNEAAEPSEEELEESSECGCGCGGEFPDQSLVENPDKPKKMADPDFLARFKKFAHAMGIVSIGYAQVDPELINIGELVYPNAIVLTLEMGKDIIKTPPGPEAQKLNDATYTKLGNITYALSDFMRANGFATQAAHPYGSMVGFSQLAEKAGLGGIGKSGLLISPELGPRQKISAIFNSIENLPLNDDKHSWILDYCEKCGKCIKACPEKALVETETCCGGKTIELVQKRCIGCSQGCTYCIEDCPFDEKGYQDVKNKFDKMNTKLAEKRSRSCC